MIAPAQLVETQAAGPVVYLFKAGAHIRVGDAWILVRLGRDGEWHVSTKASRLVVPDVIRHDVNGREP